MLLVLLPLVNQIRQKTEEKKVRKGKYFGKSVDNLGNSAYYKIVKISDIKANPLKSGDAKPRV